VNTQEDERLAVSYSCSYLHILLSTTGLAGNNQQLLLNGIAPALIEGAPFLLPIVAGAVGVGPSAFYGAAAACAALELGLYANNVEIPFVGLSAGFYLGLLVVPLGVVSALAGTALASAKK
jgi:hypothetical protein